MSQLEYMIVSEQGASLGTYVASSADDALCQMAQQAGYRDDEHAAEVAGPFRGAIWYLDEDGRIVRDYRGRGAGVGYVDEEDAPEIVRIAFGCA